MWVRVRKQSDGIFIDTGFVINVMLLLVKFCAGGGEGRRML